MARRPQLMRGVGPTMTSVTELVTRAQDSEWVLAVRSGLPWRVGTGMFVFMAVVCAYRSVPVVSSIVGAAFVGAICVLLVGLLEWYVQGLAWLRMRWPRLAALTGPEGASPNWFTPTHRLRCHRLSWGSGSLNTGVLWVAPGRACFVPDRLRGFRTLCLEGRIYVSAVGVSWLRRWLVPSAQQLLCLRSETKEWHFLVAGMPGTVDRVAAAIEPVTDRPTGGPSA